MRHNKGFWADSYYCESPAYTRLLALVFLALVLVPVPALLLANLIPSHDHRPAHRVSPRREVQGYPVDIQLLVIKFHSHPRVRERAPLPS